MGDQPTGGTVDASTVADFRVGDGASDRSVPVVSAVLTAGAFSSFG
jgi:hypothetical protein